MKDMMDHELSYGKTLNLPTIDYCHTDFAEEIDTQRSTIKYPFLLSGSAINRNKKK